MPKLDLSNEEIGNLQTYLEQLIVDEGFKTKIIKTNVVELMQKIKAQTGIGLADVMPEKPGESPQADWCTHKFPIVSQRLPGFCQICGLAIKK